MGDQLKDKIVQICIIITTLSLIIAITSGISTQKNKVKVQKEMASRLDAEEKLENSKYVVSALEEEVRKLQNQVNTEKEARQKIKEELEQEKLVSTALKEELIKTIRLKDVLESNLKEALANKSSKAIK